MSIDMERSVAEVIRTAMSELRQFSNVEIEVDADKNFEKIKDLNLHFL